MLRVLWLTLALGCGASTPARTVTEPDPAPTSNRRTTATAGSEAALVDASAFVGRWSLLHDGQAWCELDITLGPSGELVVSAPRFVDVSWTAFAVVRVKLDRTSGALELLGDYLDFESTVTVTVHPRGAGLEGTAEGETYGAPSIVLGTRIGP